MHRKIGPDLPAKISPATLAGHHLFATNIPSDEDDRFVGGDGYAQAKATFQALVRNVEAAGGTAADVAQVTIYIIDKGDLPGMNKAWDEVFTKAPWPTRATVVVADLVGPPGIRIETTASAVIG
ncbi:MAG: RidA family protein [Rhodobacteraceae bacterium]|jgi:2-iminobutanoate/2-iminopropanoate deaminase|nr:RidA family protein [Paracoccaceae bacterium]